MSAPARQEREFWPRVGGVRPSALLWSSGIGSVVDLPQMTVLIRGLDFWDFRQQGRLTENRLLAEVKRRLGPQVAELRSAPWTAEKPNEPFGEWAFVGVPVVPFPRWLRCLRPRCNRLARMDADEFTLQTNAFRPDRARYVHAQCHANRSTSAKNASPAVAARFVVACKAGHLDEFPWIEFAHKVDAGGAICATPVLTLEDFGKTLGPSLRVRCGCGAKRSLMEATGERSAGVLPQCRGRHPHLNWFDPKGCKETARMVVLGATNLWFSDTLSSLYLPAAGSDVEVVIERLWGDLDKVPSKDALGFAVSLGGALDALRKYDTDDVWAAIERRRNPKPKDQDADGDGDLKKPEWEAFTNPDAVKFDRDFQLREVSPPDGARMAQVVLAERLREVRALVGFTRIDSERGEGEKSNRAPLSRRDPEWVPAAEVRGEGIFLRLDETAVQEWEQRVRDAGTLDPLMKAHRAWRRRIDPDGDSGAGWPGDRYVLLHTLAHSLMREVALDCGYAAASISERIYSGTEEDPAAGILLYTTASDSEGTLGGLVSLGETERLAELLGQALRAAGRCSSDPLCAEHDPQPPRQALHGAACHACMFAPETSCERGNRYLDRRLLVPVGPGASTAFYPAS
jgi:hypothetical protein